VLAVATLFSFLPDDSLAGELQWRAAGEGSAKPPLGRELGAERQPATDSPLQESDRSVVVSREGERVAQAPAEFDPFEADEQFGEEDAAMPSTEPAATTQFDPFESDEAEDAAEEASVEEAFEEPTTARDELPGAARQLDEAKAAIDQELIRREVEDGAGTEIVRPELPAVDEEDAATTAPEVEDEIVGPSDDDEQETGSDSVGGLFDDELDLNLQYGGEGLPMPALTPEQLEARRQQIEKEQREHAENCEELYDSARADSIKNISLDISLQGDAGEDFPFECTGRNPRFEPRSWSQTVYLWKASGLCHKPLYFEQVQLERYGHDWGPALQPIMSGAHFFGTIPILPYKMGLETPQECVYSLGYYRPGSCAPYMITQPGFTWRAAAFQTGAVTGVAAAVP
jgi:hypothetical protein